MVDQLLGGLFGGQDDEDEPVRRQRATDFIQRYERGRPYDGIGDDEVIHNYRATAGRLSPQEYEEATAESLGRLSREERRELRRRLRHNAAHRRVTTLMTTRGRWPGSSPRLGSRGVTIRWAASWAAG